ncbi:MAG: hypothetical protein HY898_15565 [Deltaproteobacteria bacterium]|nr:hypothetical protein [Deltaproteobacteria bacterium]
MPSVLRSVEHVRGLIQSGKALLLAGDEALLAQLPKGKWIGGTIPYFISDEGGVCTRDSIFVTELPDSVVEVTVERYDEKTITKVYKDGAEASFSLIIIPASSPTHLTFALSAPTYPAFGVKPLVGWIAGVHLSDLGKAQPKVFDGRTVEALTNAAVVLRAKLAPGKLADVGIVNIFEPSEGETIAFEADGFSARQALINGEKRPLVDWLKGKAIDTRYPLVASYMGTQVNVSFQGVDAESGEVTFYAPVFAGVEYHAARPVSDYVKEFVQRVPDAGTEGIAFSCNCILNYLYSELEGKNTGAFTGPITFGEVAYQLLNQTLAYLVIIDSA